MKRLRRETEDGTLLALEQACAGVTEQDPYPSLESFVKALPLAAGVELASIRLLSVERDALHLVAQEGLPPRHVRDLALDPISRAKQRSIFALGQHHTQARSLGLRYLAGEWLQSGSDIVGTLKVGCRTDRRPSPEERELIGEAAAALGSSLSEVDRSEKRLRMRAFALARAAISEAADGPDSLREALRPRELAVLDLYAEGRTVEQIAEVLVISPHTVRTHIKLAFRRLGIHSREEAAELMLASAVTALL